MHRSTSSNSDSDVVLVCCYAMPFSAFKTLVDITDVG
jgi:hypothetical protein